MSPRIRLSEAAFAPLEVYVLDVAHLEGPDEDEAATALEIKHAIERLPNGGAVLHLPHDRDQLLRWHALLNEASNSADASDDHSWARSLTATASKVLEPLRAPKRLRENTSSQSFIRRTPSRDSSKRRFRYTYDPDLATRVNVKAKVKEKLRIPHAGSPGHYEVVARLAPNVVGVIHDETKHPMAISDLALRELARDVYRPSEDATPSEDVRYRHEREDALPRSRDDAYQAIQKASGIDDHNFAAADAAYRKWKAGKGKRRVKPPPWQGGQLDAFEGDLRRGQHFTSLLEAFEHATRGARTWRDLEPALALLRDVKGFEGAQFPNEVYDRHNRHDLELDDQGHTIDVDLYGVTMTPDMEVDEAVFLAATKTPPRLWEPLSEEDLAIAAREEEGMYEDDDLWA
jgi:hypothetical protein